MRRSRENVTGSPNADAPPLRPFDSFRHCPHCGSTNVGTPALKQFVCADCSFTYFSNAAAALMGIVRNDGGDILLVRRGREPARGKLTLPGGFVDPLETIETAMAREIEEEVGIAIRAMTYLTSFPNRYEYRGVLYFTIDLVYVCEAENPTPRRESDGDEITEAFFAPASAIAPEEIAFESGRRAIAAYRAAYENR